MSYFQQLRKELPNHILFFDNQTLTTYAQDKTKGYTFQPDVVILPENDKHVGIILAISNQYKVPLVPRGAGTGNTGGALAYQKGIVLSFEKMNKIIELDSANRTITLEPGVIIQDLHHYVERQGFYYPPDPASKDKCTIGGNIAENAGGAKAIKYGVTGDYVLGLEGYYATGQPFKLGGKLYKNVAGYDVLKLLIGSEGTLAIITKIHLRLLVKPKYQQSLVVIFSNYQDAFQTLAQVKQAGINLVSAEFIDIRCLQAIEKLNAQQLHVKKEKVRIIFQVDASEKRYLNKQIEQIIKLSRHALHTIRPQNAQDEAHIWQIRNQISEALSTLYNEKISHDIVVPPAKIPAFMHYLEKINTPQIALLGYGHLGDGNIHVNILKNTAKPISWKTLSANIEKKLFRYALELGGTLTGEHGIGLTKKKYLKLAFSEVEIKLFKDLKKAFDPNMILNPGKII